MPRVCAAVATPRLFRLVLACAVAGALVSCKSVDDGGQSKSAPGVWARLTAAGGSAVSGSVRFAKAEGGLTVMALVQGAPTGRLRIVIHTTGNCTSVNAFSAGPPMMLPGTSDPAMVWMSTNTDGVGTITTRLSGVALDGPAGINGRSVVVHMGFGSLEAQPGVPNERIACGVIQPDNPLF
jgi:Cu/Zn superoxide dismutase